MPRATPRCLWLGVIMPLLVACGERPPAVTEAPSLPAAYTPLAQGSRWTYRVTQGATAIAITYTRKGGDVRHRAGVAVRYLFLYGDSTEMGEMQAKSIYASPGAGLEEFFVDGLLTSMQHDPPVPLMPSTMVGTSWEWSGKLALNHNQVSSRSTLRVAARERLTVGGVAYDTLRVEERVEPDSLRITRWFAKGVGMLRLAVEAGERSFRMELTSCEIREP